MKKNIYSYIILFLFAIIGSSIMAFGIFAKIQEHTRIKNENSYVTGYYSKYCYKTGTENGNINKKLYFDSLYDCGKPLNK